MRNEWARLGLAAILVVAGCDDSGTTDAGPDSVDAGTARDAGASGSDAGHDAGGVALDAGPPDDDGGPGSTDAGGADAGAPDAGPPPVVTAILLPAPGAEVIHSVAARVVAPVAATRVTVSVVGAVGLECTSDVRDFECLLDVTSLPAGAFTLRAVSYDGADMEVGRDEVALTRRALTDPCAGASGDHIDCVLARATAGTSAGYAGVTYLNYDDRHARANTGRMTGIDARVSTAVPFTPPADVTLGIANESRACNVSAGWLSRPRCDSVGRAVAHYDRNIFVFWPEHRDHGTRDYFQWQGSFFDLSQGSSGTELDEVVKMLNALGMMEPSARTAMTTAMSVAPTVGMLLRRSRVATDAEYLTPEAFVTALRNAPNGDALMTLAAGLRAGELPPVARVAPVMGTFPPTWAMNRSLGVGYGLGWAPATLPATAPAGTFEVIVDVSSSTDPAGRALVFFPALLRGDPADVTIQRANVAGTQWRITGSFPADRVIMTGGHLRTVSRVTVGFFAHNGVWLGPPALLSIGGRPATEPAPSSNNLD